MNLLDAYVKKVLSEPIQTEYGWYVEVEFTCWSPKIERRRLFFRTREEAEQVKEGYMFLT